MWLFIAILIFNYSIDIPDEFGDEVVENLAFNDIESITELVLEVFMGIENAVPEHDEDDSEDGYKSAKKIDFSVLQKKSINEMNCLVVSQNKYHTSYFLNFFENPFLSAEIKPPQA